MSEVDTYRIVSIVTLLALALIGGLLPLVISSNKQLMSILNCFAAGVFIAGGFLHLLVDANENPGLAEWSEKDDGKYEFPYPNMFATLGFLLVFFIEQWAICYSDKHHMEHHNKNESAYDLEQEDEMAADALLDGKSQTAHMVTAAILFLALGFHSVLEGLGIGAQTEADWGVYAAVAVHKGLVAFALGEKMYTAGVQGKAFVGTMIVFSLLTVIGILIGWGVESLGDSEDATGSGICIALASGTFIFVALMEVIPLEFKVRENILAKCVAVFLGYAIMGMLAKWA